MKRASNGTPSSQPVTKKRPSTSILPSANEQLLLQQTSLLTRDNLSQLQISGLLSEVSCQSVYQNNNTAQWIDQFSHVLKDNMSQSIKVTPKNKWYSTVGLTKDIVDNLIKQNEKPLQIQAPAKLKMIGSHDLQCGTSPYVNIDLCISMPDSFFDHRDFLNYSYFQKRAIYVATVAELLSVSESLSALVDSSSVRVVFFKGDLKKPILTLKSSAADANATEFRLFFGISADLFELSRLLPNKNNITQVRNSADLEEDGSETSKLCRRATVEYNMSILEDIAILPQNRLLSGIFATVPAAKQAVILLKVWLTQRGLRWGVDMLDGYDVCLLVAFAVQTRLAPAQASALAIFQTIIQLLADTDLLASDVFLTYTVASSDTSGGTNKADRQRTLFSVCLFHPLVASATEIIEYNCVWRVSESSYSQLREEACHTKKLLQVGLESTFHDVFMQKSTFYQRYEIYYHVPVNMLTFLTLSVNDIKAAPHSSLGALNTQVFDLIKRALPLGDRLVSLNTLVQWGTDDTDEYKSSHWFPLSVADLHEALAGCSIVVGLVIDQNNAPRKVDRSPISVSDSAGTVSDFKRFWGDKCELRRFKDGAIVEALIWEDRITTSVKYNSLTRKSISKGETVVDNILRYVLGRFMSSTCGRVGEELYSVSCALEQLLPGHGSDSVSVDDKSSSMDPRAAMDSFSLHQQLGTALDSLRRTLASDLKSLPLLIDSVTCCQPSARYTSFYPPLPHPFLTSESDRALLKLLAGRNISLIVEPVHLHAVFGHSGKWPADKKAAAKTMTAFLIFIAEQLEKQYNIKSIVHATYLDISHMGFLFRTHFHQNIEATPPQVGADTVFPMSFPVSEYSHVASIHHQAIRALAATYPSFSKAVRLFLAWVAGHQLSGHVRQHAVELLCGSVYLHRDSRRPSSPSAGFILALKLLVDWDWSAGPLKVNFDPEMTSLKTKTISSGDGLLFHCRYGAGPAMDVLREDGALETTVKRVLLQAAKQTVKAYLEMLKTVPNSRNTQSSLLLSEEDITMKLLVDESLIEQANVVLRFNHMLLPSTQLDQPFASVQSLCAGSASTSIKVFANLPPRDMDIRNLIIRDSEGSFPLQSEAVLLMRAQFGCNAVFFWNEFRANRVAVAFRPKQFLAQSFTVLQARNKLAIAPEVGNGTKEDASVSSHSTLVNVSQVLGSIVECSHGVVESFDLK